MRDPAKLAGALTLMVGALAASVALGHCAPTQRAAIRIVPDSDGPDAEWHEVTLPPTWTLDAGKSHPAMAQPASDAPWLVASVHGCDVYEALALQPGGRRIPVFFTIGRGSFACGPLVLSEPIQ